MRDCPNNGTDYYAKTLVFVQSSAMGKSKLMNAFGESCLMINYIFRKDNGYPLGNSKILQFMILEPPDEVTQTVNKLPSKQFVAIGDSFVHTRRAIVIWNHSITIGLIFSSFEIRGFCVLHAPVVSSNLICLIVNEWVEKQHSSLSLKKLAYLKHQIMAPLDPNKKSTGGPADNKRDQWIKFYNVVVLKASVVAKNFAIDKS